MGRKITKYYDHNGLAGCVSQHQNQQTKTIIGVYNNEQAGFGRDYGPWSTLCEKHSHIIQHSSLSSAIGWAANPMGWCEGCMAEAKERKN